MCRKKIYCPNKNKNVQEKNLLSRIKIYCPDENKNVQKNNLYLFALLATQLSNQTENKKKFLFYIFNLY